MVFEECFMGGFWGADRLGYRDLDRFVLPNSVYIPMLAVYLPVVTTLPWGVRWYVPILAVYTALGAVCTDFGSSYRF